MINVHSYESMGTFDGPGLRLVVFLQGCNFRCLYCANPDTIEAKGGTPTHPDEIVRMAVSQKAFFGKKGGITFSGGEPTFQAKALIPLFKRLKEAGIHICLDTNGGLWNNDVEELLGLTDLVLLDIKDDIRQLGEHLGTYRMIQRVEILPYHTLGVHKYEAMDKEYLLKGVKENTPEQIEKAEKLFRQYFRTVQIN